MSLTWPPWHTPPWGISLTWHTWIAWHTWKCDMTHSHVTVICLIHTWHGTFTWHTWNTWHMKMNETYDDESDIAPTWLMIVSRDTWKCDMPHSHVTWHTYLTHMKHMTHENEWDTWRWIRHSAHMTYENLTWHMKMNETHGGESDMSRVNETYHSHDTCNSSKTGYNFPKKISLTDTAHTTTHYNTLQQTATHTHSNTPQHDVTHTMKAIVFGGQTLTGLCTYAATHYNAL